MVGAGGSVETWGGRLQLIRKPDRDWNSADTGYIDLPFDALQLIRKPDRDWNCVQGKFGQTCQAWLQLIRKPDRDWNNDSCISTDKPEVTTH